MWNVLIPVILFESFLSIIWIIVTFLVTFHLFPFSFLCLSFFSFVVLIILLSTDHELMTMNPSCSCLSWMLFIFPLVFLGHLFIPCLLCWWLIILAFLWYPKDFDSLLLISWFSSSHYSIFYLILYSWLYCLPLDPVYWWNFQLTFGALYF